MLPFRVTGIIALTVLLTALSGCGGEESKKEADPDTTDTGKETDSTSDFSTETESQDDSEEVSSDSDTETAETDGQTDEETTGTDEPDGGNDAGEIEEDAGTSDDGGTSTDEGPSDDGGTSTDEGPSDDGGTTESLSLEAVQPQAASRYLETELTLTGIQFEAGMLVELIFGEGAEETVISLGEATVSENGQSATVILPADESREQGLYDVRVTNPDSSSDRLESALFVSALNPPEVHTVEPSVVWQGTDTDDVVSDRSIQITGSDFVNTPWVTWVNIDDSSIAFSAVEVNFLDNQNIVAVIPSESQAMPAGAYRVWVTNPDNLAGMWINASTSEPEVFTITAEPPPVIGSIDPVQFPFNAECNPFTIQGQYFQDGAKVALLTPEGELALTVSSVTSDQIAAVIPASTLDLGYYPVRVTNPDGRYDTFYAFEAKNPTDGHFYGDFALLDHELVTARERLALEYGFDDYLGTYLYASGGIDAAGVVLGNTEIASANIFGELGQWKVAVQYASAENPRVDNEFNIPRNGHGLVRVNRWLYAIGGSSSDTSVQLDDSLTALRSVERAEILGADKTPQHIQVTRTGDGNLPYGTWYYRVSAIGGWGEGLASRETQILNNGGTLSLCWEKVSGAQSYNIYRSPAGDGRRGLTRLIQNIVADGLPEALQCLEDDGTLHPAPSSLSGTVLAGGSLAEGIWVYRVSAIVNATESLAGYRISVITDTENATVSLSWDQVPGATYNVYRSVSAVQETSGNEPTYLIAQGLLDPAWTDTGTVSLSETSPADDGISSLPVGSLSRWELLPGDLLAPREGVAVTAIQSSTKTYIYAAGGRENGGGEDYLSSMEMAEVLENGDLDIWTATESLKQARAFFTIVSSQTKRVSAFSTDELSVEEPMFLFAIAGSSSFATPPQENSGLRTIEGALINIADGTPDEWQILESDLPDGRKTYGHGGVFIDEYLYTFPGVDTEKAGTDGEGTDYEPVPLSSKSTRFELDPPEPLSDPYTDILTNFMSSNGGLAVPRSYYGTTRVNTRIFLVGGNDGSGPISSVESIPQ